MMKPELPLLYSFRRCPYAMRARLALISSQHLVTLREIKLSQKPEAFLQTSAKGEVPVLVLPDGRVIEESLGIMLWALTQNDPDNWLDRTLAAKTRELIDENDTSFKLQLDHYKYFERFPQASQQDYRKQAENFLIKLESLLEMNRYLLADRITLVDMAIFPFIRQFAGVDSQWFSKSQYVRLRSWHNAIINAELFQSIMPKYPFWQPEEKPVTFPPGINNSVSKI